jgi:hypothetical protein
MKYRLIEKIDELGAKHYVIEKDMSMGSVIMWEYVYSNVYEDIARQRFAELKQSKMRILEEIDLEPDEPEQPAASPIRDLWSEYYS